MNPRVVSLGPCHHGKEELRMMERQKTIAARQFVLSSGVEVQTCYKKVAEELEKARESYTPEIIDHLSNQDFMRMMFLDGCFITYFIEKSNKGEIELGVGSRLFPLIVHDIFLLENQLPFAVLHALMKLRFSSGSTAKEHILIFIIEQTRLTNLLYYKGHPRWLPSFPNIEQLSGLFGRGDDEALHLLDILHRILLVSPVSWAAEADQTQGCLRWEPDDMPNYTPYQFGSVMELHKAGIRFRTNNSGHLTSVRFVRNFFFPKILLPSMVINDATISQILNLMAFEMCFDSHSERGVTSFLCLMDSLISHPADVEELRAQGILNHALGSDEEVAKLFNELPTDHAGDLPVYRNVKRGIMRHRASRVRISIGRWLRSYFRVATLLITSMTFLQTYFTIFPRH